ncbi:MAG: hypothetical protein ACRDRX_27675 [Pseudonocardiaceae bacterium]
MGKSTVENDTVSNDTVHNDTVEDELASTVRDLNVFDALALLIALGLVGVGFLIGTAGGPPSGSTTSVEFTINPEDEVRPLAPGATALFPVYINNPNAYGVRVDSISEGTSKDTPSGCPAATITSAGLDGPAGFIMAGGVRTYEISVTMAAAADGRCKGQTFTLPLTVELATASENRQ